MSRDSAGPAGTSAAAGTLAEPDRVPAKLNIIARVKGVR